MNRRVFELAANLMGARCPHRAIARMAGEGPRPPRVGHGLAALSLAALGCLFAAGCGAVILDAPMRLGPFYDPANHAGDPSLSADLRRVLVLPLCSGEVALAETAAALAPVFVAALQRQNRFEVVTLSRDECRRRFGVEELSSSSALPRDLLPALRREFAADAVLFVDLTVFRGYRPLAVGLRAKLAAISDGRLIWTFDNLFSADEPAVANSARRHFLEINRRGAPVDLDPAVLQSPSRFAEYVSAAMFATLPPVALPLAPPPVKAGKPVR